MAKNDYVPAKNAQKIPWASNLRTEIATDGPTIGLTVGEVTEVSTAAADIIAGVNEIEAAITAKEARVDAATASIRAAEKIIRKNIKRGKTHSAYTNAIGQHLGVVGDEDTTDPNTSQPLLKLVKDPAGYRIEFNLQGFFDGINIYKQAAGTAGFTFLALDTSSPYIDTTNIATGTRYHAYYVLNSREVGLVSNEVVI